MAEVRAQPAIASMMTRAALAWLAEAVAQPSTADARRFGPVARPRSIEEPPAPHP
jgi:hypothetical protein